MLPKEFLGIREKLAGKTLARARNSAYVLQATAAQRSSLVGSSIVIVQCRLSAFGQDRGSAILLYRGTGFICFSARQKLGFRGERSILLADGLFSSSRKHRGPSDGILMARYDYAELHCSERECPLLRLCASHG